MKKCMRKIVEKGYDKGDYAKAYRLDDKIEEYSTEKKNIDKLIKLLKKRARILDLGCGPGIPYDKYLADKGFSLIGVDISQKHIDMAKKLVPTAKFIKADMSKIIIKEKFDAVVSFYAIFHLPKKEHSKMILKIYNMLKENGLILITMGAEPHGGGKSYEFIGSKMAWSSYSANENIKIVKKSGFEIIHQEEEGKKGDQEHHLWILARKKS